jgi:surfeit locus 1 family protein
MTAAKSFRPRLIPTLIALPLFLTLLGLGSWQLERRSWKEGLLADMQARLALPPAALADLLPLGPAGNYRPVYAVGVYRHDREMQLLARTHGGENGVQVITPLQLTETRAAEDVASGVRSALDAVLVNRGWVPLAARDPKSRPESLIQGEMVVTGILRWPAAPGLFTPKNDPARGDWYWPEVPAMAQAADLAAMAPAVIELGRASGDLTNATLPIGGQTLIDLPNNHLHYALTWYALAAALLGTYILSQRRASAA